MFSNVAIDQVHEQNNACVKGDGGAVGLTQNPQALRRWMVSGPEMARLIIEFQASMEKPEKKSNHKHHEQTQSIQMAFFNEVKALNNVIEEMENHSLMKAMTFLSLIPEILLIHQLPTQCATPHVTNSISPNPNPQQIVVVAVIIKNI